MSSLDVGEDDELDGLDSDSDDLEESDPESDGSGDEVV